MADMHTPKSSRTQQCKRPLHIGPKVEVMKGKEQYSKGRCEGEMSLRGTPGGGERSSVRARGEQRSDLPLDHPSSDIWPQRRGR